MNSVKTFMMVTVKEIEMKTLIPMVILVIISMNLSQIVLIMKVKIFIVNGMKLKIFLQIGANLILILKIPFLMNNNMIGLIKLIMMTQTFLTTLIVIQKVEVMIVEIMMKIIRLKIKVYILSLQLMKVKSLQLHLRQKIVSTTRSCQNL